jgi:hypothetical protein
MSHTSIFLGGRGSARVVHTSVVSCCDDDLERKERRRQDLVEADIGDCISTVRYLASLTGKYV